MLWPKPLDVNPIKNQGAVYTHPKKIQGVACTQLKHSRLGRMGVFIYQVHGLF